MEKCKYCGDGHTLTKEDLDNYTKEKRGIYPSDAVRSQENMNQAGYEYYVLLIPKDFNIRFTLFSGVLAQMCFRFPSMWKDGSSSSLIAMIQALAQSLSYLSNSTSFEDKVLREFDEKEIDRKLGRIG